MSQFGSLLTLVAHRTLCETLQGPPAPANTRPPGGWPTADRGVPRKQRTLARISSGLRIPLTRKSLASGSLFKLERQSSKVVQGGEPVPSSPNSKSAFLDSSARRPSRRYPPHSAGFCAPRVFSGWKSGSAGVRAHPPGLGPNPTFSLANSHVAPVDRRRLLTAPYNAGSRTSMVRKPRVSWTSGLSGGCISTRMIAGGAPIAPSRKNRRTAP